jgi:tRNA (mo5U34)-methyltransferase
VKDEEIVERIRSFPRWHYQFDLNGHLTPVARESSVNRHRRRKEYFFDPLVGLCGGSLAGKRVLDLGCNAGYWSLLAIENGCEFLLGIDGRRMHIDQANFVFKVKRIEKRRYRFLAGDVFQLDFQEFGAFDVVLCLGLMYHVSKPVTLLETIAEVNTDLLVIDTTLSRADGASLEIRYDRLGDCRDAVDRELVLVPTRRAVVELVRQFGYSVVVLRPKVSQRFRADRRERWTRRAFLCAKRTDLCRLTVPVEPLDADATPGSGLDSFVGGLSRFLGRRNPS